MVKKLRLEAAAQVVSLDACRTKKWPSLNLTGMILIGGNPAGNHFHGVAVDLDNLVFALIGSHDVHALNSEWLTAEFTDISPKMPDQVNDECGALLVLFWKWFALERDRALKTCDLSISVITEMALGLMQTWKGERNKEKKERTIQKNTDELARLGMEGRTLLQKPSKLYRKRTIKGTVPKIRSSSRLQSIFFEVSTKKIDSPYASRALVEEDESYEDNSDDENETESSSADENETESSSADEGGAESREADMLGDGKTSVAEMDSEDEGDQENKEEIVSRSKQFQDLEEVTKGEENEDKIDTPSVIQDCVRTPPNLGVTCFLNQTLLAMVMINRVIPNAFVTKTDTGDQVAALLHCMMTDCFPEDIGKIIRKIMLGLGVPSNSQEDIGETFSKMLPHFEFPPTVCVTSGRECSLCGTRSRVQKIMEPFLRLSIPDLVPSEIASPRTLQSLFEPLVQPGNFDCHRLDCRAEKQEEQRNCLGQCGGHFCDGKKWNAATVTEQVGSPFPPVVFFTIDINQGADLARRPTHFATGRTKVTCSRQVVLGGCNYDVVHLIVHEGSRLQFVEPEASKKKAPLFSQGHFVGFVLGDQCVEHDDDTQTSVTWEHVVTRAEHVMGGVLVRSKEEGSSETALAVSLESNAKPAGFALGSFVSSEVHGKGGELVRAKGVTSETALAVSLENTPDPATPLGNAVASTGSTTSLRTPPSQPILGNTESLAALPAATPRDFSSAHTSSEWRVKRRQTPKQPALVTIYESKSAPGSSTLPHGLDKPAVADPATPIVTVKPEPVSRKIIHTTTAATFHHSTSGALWPADFFLAGDTATSPFPAMGSVLRGVQDFCLWGNPAATESILESMLMPQMLEATTSFDWDLVLQVVCQQLDVTAQVYVLDADCIVTGCMTSNQTSEPKTIFRLLKLGDCVLPLLPREERMQKLPYLIIENLGEFSVVMGTTWSASVRRGTAFEKHEDLACLFSALYYLDGFHSKKTEDYGDSRWPHDGIDHFTASAARFPYAISRKTLERLVNIPMRNAGMDTEQSKLKRTSSGCTVIESNVSMIVRITLFINLFEARKPWGLEDTHIILGGGRRAGALLALITRAGMTIVSVDKSEVAHEEAIRIVDEYRRTAVLNPRVEHVLCDVADLTAEKLLGATSGSRFVGSTRSEQLGDTDRLMFESDFLRVYWNCHVSPPEFIRLIREYGMDADLAYGWKCLTIKKLRQEKTGMTVYLWMRWLRPKILVRSPEIVEWRRSAATRSDIARAVKILTESIRPDGDGFVRRSVRKKVKTVPLTSDSPAVAPSNNSSSPKIDASPPKQDSVALSQKKLKEEEAEAKKTKERQKQADDKRKKKAEDKERKKQAEAQEISRHKQAEDKERKKQDKERSKQEEAQERHKQAEDKERKKQAWDKERKQAEAKERQKELKEAEAIQRQKGLKDTKLPTPASAPVVPADAPLLPHSEMLLNRLSEQATLLTAMQAQASQREIQHLALIASIHAMQLPGHPPANPDPTVVPVHMLADLKEHTKKINDVLHTMHKNQTTNPQNDLAVKQMEVIAALEQDNKAAAMFKKMKKKARKSAAKKQESDKEMKARWKEKQKTKQLEAESAKNAHHIPSRSNESFIIIDFIMTHQARSITRDEARQEQELRPPRAAPHSKQVKLGHSPNTVPKAKAAVQEEQVQRRTWNKYRPYWKSADVDKSRCW